VYRSIPVIFNPSTIYNQYPYHIGEQDARAISVNIPGRSVRFNKVQLMDLLLSIPAHVIRQKQRALARVAPRVCSMYVTVDKPLHDAMYVCVTYDFPT
jgi:hypothetical protein